MTDLIEAASLIPDPATDKVLVDLAKRTGRIAAEVDAINHGVKKARQMGASWTQVGAALGISKQAAQQRYGGHG